jgi:alanine racemase
MILLDDLLQAGGQLVQPGAATAFVDFSYDSRLTRPGELFVALHTPRADGHDYIPAALAAGATGIICARIPYIATDATVILADNPEALMQQWASRRLQQVAPTVIGVTGSVGKTSTKHALATLLSAYAPTFSSRQSFNSLLGLPVALAHLTEDHRFAVLEYGTSSFGEIARLAALFPPRIALVTNIGGAHLDVFDTPEEAAREKSALVAALPPDGWTILNGDDTYAAAMRVRTAGRTLLFGRQRHCHLRATGIEHTPHGASLRLHWQGAEGIEAAPETMTATIPLHGEPAVSVALAAVSASLVCGLPLEAAVNNLDTIAPLPGRLNVLPAQSGALLIDDTFNAALPSVLAALRLLEQFPARRHMVLLGELNDLGDHAAAAYEEIGKQAGQVSDFLICKGDWGQAVAQAARQAGISQTAVVHTAAGVLEALPADLREGDVVLVKGSAEARMERVVAGLLRADIPAGEVLVRQESAWASVRIGAPDRPTWIRVDLDALAHNIRRLREIAGVPLMMVLKADAYGHGAVRAARTALANGAAALAVATLGEARMLREADITAPVLVLGYTPPWQAREALRLDAACTVFDLDVARALAEAAAARYTQATVHVKVDTGMTRLGLFPAQAGDFLRQLAEMPELHVAGLYTHFATADSADETFARTQLERFNGVLEAITAAGLRPPVVHAANSAALLRLPDARFDMVRPGIACYGLHPAPETQCPPDMRPVLSFHSEVAQVKEVPAGTPISYGCTFETSRPSRIAPIPVGYADGLRRSPPWREMLVRGQRAPIVGRVCMDYAMLDVTDIPGVKRGDPVVLIGAQGDDSISADEVAGWLDTINYEVVSTLLPRVPREVEL